MKKKGNFFKESSLLQRFLEVYGMASLDIVILLIICLLHAVSAAHYADFDPINGTFQNYNPVRRLLAGQIPYKDFQDYLGMGHLYAGAVMTFLFGGGYQRSLVAFSFLSTVSLSLMFLTIGCCVLQKKSAVLKTVNVMLLMILTNVLLFQNVVPVLGEVRDALYYAVHVGNSARFVRAMILPIDCMLLWAASKAFERISCRFEPERKKYLVAACGTGFLAGFSFLWSNDYGISAWVCLAILTFLISLSRTAKISSAVLAVLLEIISSLACIFVLICFLTRGHFKAWISFTFAAGSYQSWYYNMGKSYYLFDVDISYAVLAQAFLTVFYLSRIFRLKAEKDAMIRYGIPAFANMVCFCAVNEYRIISGNDAREVALAVLFITLFLKWFVWAPEN